ncbi:hypothetical protein C6501_07195 [Candidatus Poribacteria bacterium]|nr:MAG: hypothetical protein C6501_07195 [Candidatus Poribacteria bacterium]
MKKTLFLILAIGVAICAIPNNTTAQDAQDWHLRGLPEGAKARFGKGWIAGNIKLSHDGERLAVPCNKRVPASFIPFCSKFLGIRVNDFTVFSF